MRNKCRIFKVLTFCLVLAFTVLVICSAHAKVNIRVKNTAKRFQRVLAPLFLKGYTKVEESLTIKEGSGKMKGDASVYGVYFEGDGEKYKALKKDPAKRVKSKANMVIIDIDVYQKPSAAKKNVLKAGLNEGSLSGANLGDLTRSMKSPKMTVEAYKVKMEEEKKKKEDGKKGKKDKKPEKKKRLSPKEKREQAAKRKKEEAEQKKKDAKIQKKLDADPNNFHLKQIVVVKRNVQISVKVMNYQKEPEDSFVESIITKLVNKV